jgi:hypothetical protein
MQLPRVLISLEVDGSREVHESPETFPGTCARARFAGCTFMRHITLAINTEYEEMRKYLVIFEEAVSYI